jgi:glycyl-tRNA synthetase beta chain
MPTLLFEIGCEELPASACREAEAQLPELCQRWFAREPSKVYVGPRRLAVLIQDLPEFVAGEAHRGPAEGIAFDDEGRPTKAAEGFARGKGVSVDSLERRDGYVWAFTAQQPIRESLDIRLQQIVRDLRFSKAMAWPEVAAEPDFNRFARPVRWLCAKLDSETVPVELDGVPSGGRSIGHRFTAGPVEIAAAGVYAETLRAAGVEPDAEERRRAIVEALDAIGGWSDPGGVLEEVVYLVEKPMVLEGSFDERFLALPEQVVVTAMQAHQRYFPLGGSRFAFVANGGDPARVREGNERVLGGRLEDASFTFERDVKLGIDTLAERLGSITFVAGAGSMADKSTRLVRLVEALGGGDASKEAARLAKADQAAELVREFPDLEGHIGAEYARLAGYPEAVCQAIEEQYLPDSAGGPLPESEAGRVLAVAEKIDNLTVAFSLGERPTGTRDPYGLRRAAIGLCRLATASGFPIDLRELVALCHRLLVEQGADVSDEPPEDVADFVSERLEGLLRAPVEFVRAARGAELPQLGQTAGLAIALSQASDRHLAAIHTAYTRASRLAGKEAGQAASSLDTGLLVEPAEREVVDALDRVAPQIDAALAEDDFDRALAAAGELGPSLDRFFEDVLVMADDSAVRANRLRLLLDVRDTIGRLGDFSEIPL